MECNSKESIIVELNGLPGTGKSTILEELCKIAELEGWRICSEYIKKTSPYTPLFKLRSYQFLSSLLRLGRLHDFTKERFGQILRCLNYINSYLDFQKDSPQSTLYVLDEGIIQSLVSIAYLESFRGKEQILEQLFKSLLKQNVRWYSVNCINEPEICFERVLKRGSNLGRMDQMKKAELINALRFQVETFDIVRKEAKNAGVLLSTISIDIKQAPVENAKIIMNWINNN